MQLIVTGSFLCFLSFLTAAIAVFCDAPSPAFPLPQIPPLSDHHREKLTDRLNQILSNPAYDTTHLSLSAISSEQPPNSPPLFTHHHTARNRSTLRPGAPKITNTTAYRIASISKTFTVLALLHLEKAGHLRLDDSILRYIPSLDSTGHGKGLNGMPWKDITLRSMASQSAGIPRDFAQGDLISHGINLGDDIAERLGLPSPESLPRGEVERLPKCDGLSNYTRACNATDLLDWVDGLRPLFAPNQQTSYSNIAFDLLGLVIANTSNTTYESYIQSSILDDIGMNLTSFTTPRDERAAIPRGVEYYWDFEIGVQNPTGGLYTCTDDLDRYLRWVLNKYNGIDSVAGNWFTPEGWSGSLDTVYGMPWEVLREKMGSVLGGRKGVVAGDEDGIEEQEWSSRPLTFITKGGELPGYSSEILMIPELGLGVSFLIAGDGMLLAEVREYIVQEIVALAERTATKELQKNYAGTYAQAANSAIQGNTDCLTNSPHQNYSITLATTPQNGLHITSWHMKNTNTLAVIHSLLTKPNDTLIFHVVPTLLYIDEKNQRGERWRIIPRKLRPEGKKSRVWDNFCVANWEMFGMYAGNPLNEVVFWREGNDNEDVEIEFSGFRKRLKRGAGKDEALREGEGCRGVAQERLRVIG